MDSRRAAFLARTPPPTRSEVGKKWMRNVICTRDGLRIHSVPKVASSTIGTACQPRVAIAYADEPGDGYRFMVVRHPLDRMVSAWAFFCDPGDSRILLFQDLQEIGYRVGMPFEEFLEIVLERHDDNHHTRMQTAYAGPFDLDEIAPLSRLEEAWERLRQRFGCLVPLKNRINASNRDVWREYFTPESCRRAEAVFADDIALFERAARWQ